MGFDYEDTIREYIELRDKNKEVIDKLNELRKKLRYLASFNDGTRDKIITDTYKTYSDLSDISEILGVSECETFYRMIECQS